MKKITNKNKFIRRIVNFFNPSKTKISKPYYWENPPVIVSSMKQSEIDALLVCEKYSAGDPSITDEKVSEAVEFLEKQKQLKWSNSLTKDIENINLKIK